jgi:hypothetical protein
MARLYLLAKPFFEEEKKIKLVSTSGENPLSHALMTRENVYTEKMSGFLQNILVFSQSGQDWTVMPLVY